MQLVKLSILGFIAGFLAVLIFRRRYYRSIIAVTGWGV